MPIKADHGTLNYFSNSSKKRLAKWCPSFEWVKITRIHIDLICLKNGTKMANLMQKDEIALKRLST